MFHLTQWIRDTFSLRQRVRDVLQAADKVLDDLDRIAVDIAAFTSDDKLQTALKAIREQIARDRGQR